MHHWKKEWRHVCSTGFPGGSDGKESACNVGDLGSIPGLGRFPWRRAWQPTPVFLPGESPWTKVPGSLQSMGSQRVRHNWATKHSTAQQSRFNSLYATRKPNTCICIIIVHISKKITKWPFVYGESYLRCHMKGWPKTYTGWNLHLLNLIIFRKYKKLCRHSGLWRDFQHSPPPHALLPHRANRDGIYNLAWGAKNWVGQTLNTCTPCTLFGMAGLGLGPPQWQPTSTPHDFSMKTAMDITKRRPRAA